MKSSANRFRNLASGPTSTPELTANRKWVSKQVGAHGGNELLDRATVGWGDVLSNPVSKLNNTDYSDSTTAVKRPQNGDETSPSAPTSAGSIIKLGKPHHGFPYCRLLLYGLPRSLGIYGPHRIQAAGVLHDPSFPRERGAQLR